MAASLQKREAVKFRTVTAYVPEYPDRTIDINIVTEAANGLPRDYECVLDSNGRGSVSLPTGYRYEVKTPSGRAVADLRYSLAPISLFDWTGLGASDDMQYNAILAAFGGLSAAADKLAYFTDADSMSLTTLTAFIRTLLDDADAATARVTLDVPSMDEFVDEIQDLQTADASHANKTTSVHGIADTSALALSADVPTALTDLDTTVTGAQLNADHATIGGLGTMATESADDYVAAGGGAMTGALVVNSSGLDTLLVESASKSDVFAVDTSTPLVGVRNILRVYRDGAPIQYLQFYGGDAGSASVRFVATSAKSLNFINETNSSLGFFTNNTERVRIAAAGNMGINTTAPTAKLDINSDIIRLRTQKTPASATAAGNAGDMCWDSNYIYRCVATNTWKRTPLSTW